MPTTQFPAVFNLTNLNGQNGFKLDGENNNDGSGGSVSGVGDVNGDGYADLIIGAFGGYPNGKGRSYVVFGGLGIGSGGVFNLSSLNGANGFKLDGENNADYSGYSVSAGRDINGDGYEDVIIGAYGYPAGNFKGSSYAVFGGPRVGSSGVFALSSLNGSSGFKLDGENNNDFSGISVSTAGDTNGDGYDDVIIGASEYPGSVSKGRSYVMFGGPGVGNSGDIALSSLNGTNGFKLDGENNGDYSGSSVSTAGDINGDGHVDLIIGANGYLAGSEMGRSYVVFGGPGVGSSGDIALSSLNGVNGFKLNGENNLDNSGASVGAAGDINGDGYDDLIIGAVNCPGGPGLGGPGRSYVVFGGPGIGSSGIFSLSSLNGVNGFKLDGENNGDYSGNSVSGAGDINGDGYADLIIGARFYLGASNKGRSYVLFGGPGMVGDNGVLSLSNLTGLNGFKLNGENNNDYSGQSVSIARDINGDGIIDLIIGAPGYPGGSNKGRSYVVFGDVAPQLWTNQLTIGQGKTQVLTSQNMNATDNSLVAFSVGNVTHGYFEQISQPGQAVTHFNQSSVWGQQIQFVHDDSLFAPAYDLQVLNAGIALPLAPQPSTIIFYRRPVLLNNQLLIDQGESVLITPALLNVTDDYPSAQINFTIHNLQHGQFQLLPGNNSVVQFSEGELLAGQVSFIQDGSSSPPGYQITVSDPDFALPPSAASVTFYQTPSLIHNLLSIHQGERLLLDSGALSLTEDYPHNQVILTVTNVQHGQFELLPLNQSVVQFTEQQWLSGQVILAADGSAGAPDYQIGLSDPYFTVSPVDADIRFYHRPVLNQNQLSVTRNSSVLITLQQLNVTDDYPATQVLFTVQTAHGQFELISSNNVATPQFTQQQLEDGQIQFHHDGSIPAPEYNVTVSDPYFTVGPMAGSVSYQFIAFPPYVSQSIPPLTVHIGETINYPIPSNTFIDPNDYHLQLSALLADGESLPVGIQFESGVLSGLLNEPVNLNISITATDTAELSATTFFALQIAGAQPPSSILVDVKTLASVMSSVGGVLLAGLAFLYAGYRNKNKREFENPFANAIHELLKLSYADFFNGEGKQYATAITGMMKLLKTQSGVDLKALGKTSADIADQNRYRYYADLFADVIRQQVAIKSIYCGTSYELRLEELKEHGEQIVNTVIAHISHASETTIQATGQPRGWCGFFSSCCPSRQHRLSDIELDEMKGDSLIRSSETREGQRDPGSVDLPSMTNS